MSNLRNLLAVSKTFNLPLRITEAATLSYGGVQGVSDIAGAAIWVLDTAMEVCYNGAEGIIFHQVRLAAEPAGPGRRSGGGGAASSWGSSSGAARGQRSDAPPAAPSIPPQQPHPQNLEKAIARNANYNAIDWLPDNRVRVRMPYYGMLLVQQALAGGADMLDRNTAGECTAFVLKGRAASDLRVLVVNKAQKGDCAVDLKLTPEQAAKYADTASVDYLYAGGFGGRGRRGVQLGGAGREQGRERLLGLSVAGAAGGRRLAPRQPAARSSSRAHPARPPPPPHPPPPSPRRRPVRGVAPVPVRHELQRLGPRHRARLRLGPQGAQVQGQGRRRGLCGLHAAGQQRDAHHHPHAHQLSAGWGGVSARARLARRARCTARARAPSAACTLFLLHIIGPRVAGPPRAARARGRRPPGARARAPLFSRTVAPPRARAARPPQYRAAARPARAVALPREGRGCCAALLATQYPERPACAHGVLRRNHARPRPTRALAQ
jgi:hypothetical protein